MVTVRTVNFFNFSQALYSVLHFICDPFFNKNIGIFHVFACNQIHVLFVIQLFYNIIESICTKHKYANVLFL